MNKIEYILNKVREETDSVILFSSITGKDSILLTHYCAKIFNHVASVFMYVVKDLDHVAKYQRFFESNYPNIKYYHVPHFTLSWHIRRGFMGIKKDNTQKKIQLADIDQSMRDKTGINWSVYGMKQFDGLNRRLQLRQYEFNAICRKSRKVYPLSELSNSQVIGLIKENKLPMPVLYNNDRSQSQDIADGAYLSWLYENYPADLQRTFKAFPGTKIKFNECKKRDEAK